jgi:hypothetical protein
VYLNISIAIIVGLFFIVASVQSDAKKLAKLFCIYTVCLLLLVALHVFLGGDIQELLKLEVIGKNGVATGIIYGCIIGTGVGIVIALTKGHKIE